MPVSAPASSPSAAPFEPATTATTPRDELARVRRRQVGQASLSFYRWRAWAAATTAVLTLVLLLGAEVPAAQLGSMVGMMAFLCGYLVLQAWRTRGEPKDDRTLLVGLAVNLLVIVVLESLSGGFASPLLVWLSLPIVSAFTSFGKSRASLMMLGLLAVSCVPLALTTWRPPFPPIGEPWRMLLTILCVASSAAALYRVVTGLTDAFLAAGTALDKMRAQALQATEARTRDLEALGAKVAHEVKNPLTAVKTLVELVLADPASDRNQKRLGVAREEVGRIEELMHDYLTLARPFEELAQAPVALETLAAEVMALLEVRAANAGVLLACEGPPCTLLGDGRKLYAALFNLVANALEATPRSGAVRIGWQRSAAAVEIVVHDGGPPLSDEVLARIGQPFFTTKAGGTGLGVAVARSAFEQHGGGLVFQRAERGTRAIARLPDTAAQAEPAGRSQHG